MMDALRRVGAVANRSCGKLEAPRAIQEVTVSGAAVCVCDDECPCMQQRIFY